MKYLDYFAWIEKDCGHGFVCLKDDAPDELGYLVWKIHQAKFNKWHHQWIYIQIFNAFLALEKLEDFQNPEQFEAVLDEVCTDVCQRTLFEWAENFMDLVDERFKERKFLFENILQLFSLAQRDAIESVYNSVWEFLKKYKE